MIMVKYIFLAFQSVGPGNGSMSKMCMVWGIWGILASVMNG